MADLDDFTTASPELNGRIQKAEAAPGIDVEEVDVIPPDATGTEAEGMIGNASETQSQNSSLDPVALSRPQVNSGSSSLGSSMAQPKRFSAMNINKRFLEKASSSSGTTANSSTLAAAKAGGPIREC